MTSLSIGGPCAANPIELTTADLSRVHARHQVPDISSVLQGRRGAAVRLAALAELADTRGARFVHVESADGSFTANLPLEQALEHGLVLYSLDGEPLPAKFGGPFRLLLAEGEDCSVNVKFLAGLTFVATPGSHTARCAE